MEPILQVQSYQYLIDLFPEEQDKRGYNICLNASYDNLANNKLSGFSIFIPVQSANAFLENKEYICQKFEEFINIIYMKNSEMNLEEPIIE